MIGLSVSRCFSEMARGIVDESTVQKVIGATSARTPAAWDSVIANYRRYWGDYANTAEKLLREFLAAGKVEQPRITFGMMPYTQNTGIWVETEADIVKIPYPASPLDEGYRVVIAGNTHLNDSDDLTQHQGKHGSVLSNNEWGLCVIQLDDGSVVRALPQDLQLAVS